MQSYKLLLGLFLALAFWQCTKEDQIRTETETTGRKPNCRSWREFFR